MIFKPARSIYRSFLSSAIPIHAGPGRFVSPFKLEDLKIYKSELRSYRFLFLHLRAPAVCAFVFLSCLSFSNLPAIRNSARQKQTLSSMPWVLSRTPSAPTTLSPVGLYPLSLLSPPFSLATSPPTHLCFFRYNPFIQPLFLASWLHSKRCCLVYEQHVQ